MNRVFSDTACLTAANGWCFKNIWNKEACSVVSLSSDTHFEGFRKRPCFIPPVYSVSPACRCVRLPDVLEAYEGTGSYTKEQRHLLVSHLEDPEQRKHPWPAKLDVAFGIEDPEEVAAREAAAAAAAAAESAGGEGGGGVKTEAAGRDTGAARSDRSLPGGGRGCGGGGGRGNGSRGPGGRFSSKGRRAGFGGKGGAAVGMAMSAGGIVLLGSPMVDATLEDTEGLKEVIGVLKREMGQEGQGGLKMEVCACSRACTARIVVAGLEIAVVCCWRSFVDHFVCSI